MSARDEYEALEWVPDGEMGFDPGGREVKALADAALAEADERIEQLQWQCDFHDGLMVYRWRLTKTKFADWEQAAKRAEELLTEDYKAQLDAAKVKRLRAEKRAEKWEWIAKHEVCTEVIDLHGHEVPTIEEREEWELSQLMDASEDR